MEKRESHTHTDIQREREGKIKIREAEKRIERKTERNNKRKSVTQDQSLEEIKGEPA